MLQLLKSHIYLSLARPAFLSDVPQTELPEDMALAQAAQRPQAALPPCCYFAGRGLPGLSVRVPPKIRQPP